MASQGEQGQTVELAPPPPSLTFSLSLGCLLDCFHQARLSAATMRPSLLVSCLLLANCLSSSVSRVPCRAAVSTASTHHISRRRGEAKGNCDAIAPSYVAVGGVSGFIQDWGEKIERFKQGCVEIQPKIINLNRR